MDAPHRLDYRACLDLIRSRLGETSPPPIQLLTGPRQVGKTTLLLELLAGKEGQTLYAAADGPEAALPGFWERLWSDAEGTARRAGRCILLLDEVQHLGDWAGRVKGEWDRLRRKKLDVRVVLTGSSAIHPGRGSSESLAGRFEKLTLAHWNAGAIARLLGIAPAAAARLTVERGGYPGAAGFLADPLRWASYVRDAIVEPAIGRDILALAPVRKPALLRQVFAVAACCPAAIVSIQKLKGQMQDAGALETIARYLELLEEAWLVAALQKYSVRPLRRRSSPPKLVPLSNAYLAVVDPRGVPEPGRDPARFGAWVENACLASAWNAGQDLTYWREEPLEVDGVLSGSWGRWAIEVKSGRLRSGDVVGLAEFTRRFPAWRALLLCDPEELPQAERFGVPVMAWTEFLLHGPPVSRT